MKKSVLYLSLILLAGVLSCRKVDNEQRLASGVEDDSIARIEAQQKAAEEAKVAAEQARIDSIRQDSIRQENMSLKAKIFLKG